MLATKIFPLNLEEILKMVECVIYVQNSPVKHCIFKELCNKMGSEFEVLLYYSNVWWLSQENMLNCVFFLHVELAVLLQEHQHHHADCFENSEFIRILAYMVDIFNALNILNQ